MTYRLSHQTNYAYDREVSVSHQVLQLRPRDLPWQRCLAYDLKVRPEPDVKSARLDYFGNHAVLVTVEKAHRQFEVTAVSTVKVEPRPPWDPEADRAWERVRAACDDPRWSDASAAGEYRFDSPLVRRNEEIGAWSAAVFDKDRPLLEAVGALNSMIHSEFVFDPKATTVTTPVEEVFERRRGVCQDFAHLMLTGLRSLGLPARYVSGYLETLPPAGKPRLVGADASHAWVSVWSPVAGWVDFDPTNDIRVGERHITVAWGRDYGDVCPVHGVLVGSGRHSLRVSVDVEPVGTS